MDEELARELANIRTALTFDDISIYPKEESDIPSRRDPEISLFSQISPHHIGHVAPAVIRIAEKTKAPEGALIFTNRSQAARANLARFA